nr:hypothetical protein CFP56_07676 [Quercus suber]
MGDQDELFRPARRHVYPERTAKADQKKGGGRRNEGEGGGAKSIRRGHACVMIQIVKFTTCAEAGVLVSLQDSDYAVGSCGSFFHPPKATAKDGACSCAVHTPGPHALSTISRALLPHSHVQSISPSGSSIT